MNTLKPALLLILVFSLSSAYGQYYFELTYTAPVSKELRALTKLNGAYSDSVQLQQKINTVKTALFAQGYVFSSAQIQGTDSVKKLRVVTGKQARFGTLTLDSISQTKWPQLQENLTHLSIVDSTQIRQVLQQQLQVLENNGYPFAKLILQDFSWQQGKLNATLQLSEGDYITFDSIVLKGYDEFSSGFIKHHLGFKKGMPYSEKYVSEIPSYLRQIEFVRQSSPPAVAFTKGKTILYLYLEEQKNNQVSGVVGLNSQPNGQVQLTGEFHLRLLNLLHKGEEIKLDWQSPGNESQNFKLKLNNPYLFNSPFWLGSELSIFKQDSSFVTNQIGGQVKFLIDRGSFIKAGVRYKSSNVLGSEATQSSFKAYKTISYLLGVEINKANHSWVPTAGYQLNVEGFSAKRNANSNNSNQYGWEISLHKWQKLWASRHILQLKLQSEALLGKDLFANELYRIGGIANLRGFNEQSIYTSSYGLGSLEYRFMIGALQYLSLFSDVAYTENKTVGGESQNGLIGVGAGLNLQTDVGIFSLAVAVGKTNGNPFVLKDTKIHFGYINRF